MVKLLPVGVLILLVLGSSWFLITRQRTTSTLNSSPVIEQSTAGSKPVPLTVSATSDNSEIKTLQDAIIALSKKLNGDTSTSIATLESKVSSLEDKVTSLQRQVSQLQTGTTPAPVQESTSTKKSPVYIPLGWVASSSVLDWTTISTESISIDTNDYPGMTSAQFEGRIVNYQGNGTCFSRIINTTDGSPLLGSQISASASDYSWVISPAFSLSGGKKTYAVQLKTNTGYAAQISDARLKINF
ncbi:MAG: hypothetical protein PHQ59_05455 [Candidatus Daviesbacteria bacterium]|nr:hypothetical protein [Candidatus Daviesbacteria bacterium]